MKFFPSAKTAAGACLIVSAFFYGCEPYNSEQLFPLPSHVWDRAVKAEQHKTYEIKNVPAQEFISLKALLLSSGFKQVNRDFFFASRTESNTKLHTPSAQAEILIKPTPLANGEILAAAYITKERRLLLVSGVQEK